MTEANFTKPLPTITPEAKPFWDGAANNKLLMQRCLDCRNFVWTPRPSCFECGSEQLEWQVRDPIGQKEEVYREVARQIEGLVMRLILELRAPPR